MKRMLFAGAVALAAASPAFAADLIPPPAPPPQAPATYIPTIAPVYNWGGIYLGIVGGYGFGQSEWTQSGGTTGNFDIDGAVIGGTIGANFQSGPFVFGIEGDGEWTNINGTTSATNTFCASCETLNDWLGTFRGRAGYAFDRVLVYATGGGAVGNIQSTIQGSGLGTSTSTEFGWSAGGGVEFAMTDNITAKVEYLFVDLENGSCTAACGSPTPPVNVSFDASMVRAGVNLKFNPF
jgi:outer membrane immunogenic protein